jgi:hypothetical protein
MVENFSLGFIIKLLQGAGVLEVVSLLILFNSPSVIFNLVTNHKKDRKNDLVIAELKNDLKTKYVLQENLSKEFDTLKRELCSLKDSVIELSKIIQKQQVILAVNERELEHIKKNEQ